MTLALQTLLNVHCFMRWLVVCKFSGSLLEMWWLIVHAVAHCWRCGGSLLMQWLTVGDVVAHCSSCGSLFVKLVAHCKRCDSSLLEKYSNGSLWEVRWLIVLALAHCL